MKLLAEGRHASVVERGNEPASVPVGRHFVLGALLLALGAVAWIAEPFAFRGVPRAAPLSLAGFTLAFEGIAFWYFPSFAKRFVQPVAVATWAGPLLFPAAFLFAEVGLDAPARLTLALALAALPLVLLWRGPVWRSGVPFWRAEGEYRDGDRAAMIAFAAGCALLLAAAFLTLVGRNGEPTWLGGLALLTLGGLDHLLPRTRQAPLRRLMPVVAPLLVVAGFGALETGNPFWGGILVGFGLLAAVASLSQPREQPRAPGARLRDARWPLGAAFVVAAATGALLGFGYPDIMASLALAFPLGALLVGLALAGLALLVVPVMFNQVPRRALVAPAAVLAGLGALVAATDAWSPSPWLPWAGRVLAGLGLAALLGALEPLRKPRRDCEPS